MSDLIVNHTNGDTTLVRNIDTVRVVDGVLEARRAPYSDGVQETVKSMPIANIKSWEIEN